MEAEIFILHFKIIYFITNHCLIWGGTLKLHLDFDKQQRGNNIVKGEPYVQRKCKMLCTAHWPVIFILASDLPTEAPSNPNLKNLYNQNPY